MSRITDVPAAEFQPDSTLDALGIDSLMVTEIVTELKSKMGVEIAQDDLPKLSNFEALYSYVRAKSSSKARKSRNARATGSTKSQKGRNDGHKSLDTVSMKRDDETSKLAQLLASHLEAEISSITLQANLAELGLDSLLCMELASDIEKEFATKFDVTELTFESNFGDLAHMVFGAAVRAPVDPESQTDSPASSIGNMTLNDDDDASSVTSVGEDSTDSKPPAKVASSFVLNTQETLEDMRYDLDLYAKEAGFADFWKLVYPRQARLVAAYTREAFTRLGCPIDRFKVGDVIPRIEALQKHSRLVDILYEILRDDGLVEFTGFNYVRSEKACDETNAADLYARLCEDFPQNAKEFELLETTGSILADLLAGAKDPLQLLFGKKKNKQLLEEVYTNGPMYYAMTKLLSQYLSTALSINRKGQCFNIIEIGGGTGGTTKYLVKVLLDKGIDFHYTFTDISSSLVANARRKFSKYAFMDFRLLDVEKAPPTELSNRYHVAISTNCIHATSNLEQSTKYVRQMLREDGLIALCEFTKNMFWFDMVFGLLEGWWLFSDGRQHVLGSEPFWEKSLRKAGYQHVAMTGGTSLESQTYRIIVGWSYPPQKSSFTVLGNARSSDNPQIETLVYKSTETNLLRADFYYPKQEYEEDQNARKRPIGKPSRIPWVSSIVRD